MRDKMCRDMAETFRLSVYNPFSLGRFGQLSSLSGSTQLTPESLALDTFIGIKVCVRIPLRK